MRRGARRGRRGAAATNVAAMGGVWSPAALFAGAAGCWLPSDLAHLWQDAAATTPVAANNDAIGRIDDQSGNGSNATQSSTARPLYKTGGYRQYDGSNDCLVTTAKAGASGNTLAVKTAVPATISVMPTIAGVNDSGTANRWFLAVDTNGHLCGGVGTVSNTTIVGTTDIRGQTGMAMLIEDGSNVYLYWNGNLEYSGAKSGSPSTASAIWEGCRNNNGALNQPYAGGIHDLLSIQRALTAGERAKLLSYWGLA